jgi:peptidoglycan/xylan/chitin deacetylase (PgdA/CDA1 family)
VTRIAERVFRRHMESLARTGWRTLTLPEYAEGLDSAFRVPPSAFLLTFDDGYASLAELAYPILAELGFTATTFVITDYVGKTNTWDVPYALRRLPHLDWRTIEQWRGRGFEFQSHSASHGRLTWLGDQGVADELRRSRHSLVHRFGADAGRAIAYPFGAVDARVARLAQEAGYELGFGSRPGAPQRLRLTRMPVYFWDAFGMPLGVRGGMVGAVGRSLATIANRCAVGTSVMLGLGRAAGGFPGRPAPQRRGEEHSAD